MSKKNFLLHLKWKDRMRIVWVIQGENMQTGLYFLVVISTGSLELLLNKGASVKHTLLQTTEKKKIMTKMLELSL